MIKSDLKSFTEYITERAEQAKKLVVLICTANNPDPNDSSKTSTRIKEECDSLGLTNYFINTNDVYLKNETTQDENIVLYNYKDKKIKLKVNPNFTAAIIRGSVSTTESGRSFITALENSGCFVINSRKAFEVCNNKFLTTQLLSNAKIDCPKTIMSTSTESLDKNVELIGGKYPIIIKTLGGAEGIGVSIADSRPSLISFLQTLSKQNIEVLLQEYLPIKYDIRTIILNGKIVASMKRLKVKNDFRTNASLGAKVQKYKLTAEEEAIALKAAKTVGAFYCGVDLFNINGKIYVVEINTSPGSAGIEKATGENVIGQFIKHISNKENWKYSFREAGYVESAKIFLNGKQLIADEAKFDTGNGKISSVHADDIEVNGKKVSFTINSQRYTDIPIVYTSTVSKVGMEKKDERPCITVDIEVGAKRIKNEMLALTNRLNWNDKTKTLEPILLNRDIAGKFNLLINPSKKHLL